MRAWMPLIVAVVVAVGGGLGVIAYLDYQESRRSEEAREARRARRSEREQAREAAIDRVRSESDTVVPRALAGAALGQREADLRRHRPQAAESRVARQAAERWLEERLPNGAQALYGFTNERLVMIQVLSRIRPEGTAPHLTALQELYGTPTAVYRCPAESAAGVPTLRFLWRKNHITVQDIFLIHPGGVSVTLYIAPTEVIASSLQVAACRPVRSREELNELPIATPEMLEGRQTPRR
ncbi:MAG: hypothetical protein AAGE52_06870 [Myxococcota bacterium]